MRAQPIAPPPPTPPLPPLKKAWEQNKSPKPTAIAFQGPYPRTNQNHQALLVNPLTSSSYASALDSCKCPELGKQIHGNALKVGFHGDEFVCTKLLQMYGRCGCLEDADLLFDKMPQRNLYSWVAILGLYVDHELFEEAFFIFQQLLLEDLSMEFFLFPLALKVCSGLEEVKLGRQLHGIVVKFQFVKNTYVGNALIDMYGKCERLDYAKAIFSTMAERDRVSWNSIVTACAANGMVYEALELLEQMKNNSCNDDDSISPNLVSWGAVIGGFANNGYDEETIGLLLRMQEESLEPNARILASVLPACARLQNLNRGKELHGYITRHGFLSNPFIVNGLIDVYRRCDDMGNAFELFSKFSVKNVVSWNTMIVGFCENSEVSKAKELFDQMETLGVKKDIISWNSMITGYVGNFLFGEALRMFRDLISEDGIEPDSFTLGSVLTACADMAARRKGKEIHSYAIVRGLHSNTFVGGALVELYCKLEDLVSAQMAFDQVTKRDTATWNALISGYARCNQPDKIQHLIQEMKEESFEPNIHTWNGIIAGYVENDHHDAAMQLFSKMQSWNLRPDIYTVGIILPACSRLATLERGKQVHSYSIKCGYDSDVHIGVSLVDMYSKCGSIKYALLAYNRILSPNLVSHNAILTAYAMHGNGEEGIPLFREMLAAGFRPDHVSFLSVLSSCVYAGSINAGLEFFELMASYNVRPSLKHYTCLVDLLSRAGKVSEAYELLKKIPMEADSVIWGVLLAGCVGCGNVEIGELAAKRLIELEPNNTGNYVLLANLYSCAGKWSDLARIRWWMKEKGLQKSPGCSWIEVRDEVHVFLACDASHLQKEDIYTTIDNLTLHMKTVSEIVL